MRWIYDPMYEEIKLKNLRISLYVILPIAGIVTFMSSGHALAPCNS